MKNIFFNKNLILFKIYFNKLLNYKQNLKMAQCDNLFIIIFFVIYA